MVFRNARRTTLLALSLPSLALAGTLRGRVELPPLRAPAPSVSGNEHPLGYWRLENGRLPIGAPVEARGGVVAVLTPAVPRESPPSEARVPLEVRASSFEPRVLAAASGTTFLLRNSDGKPHTIYLDKGDNLLPRETLAPGQTRELRLTIGGEYQLRDADQVQALATLLVVDGGYAARMDDRGEFKVEAPDGKYTLKVWARGAWATSQTVDVGKSPSLTVRVPAHAGELPASQPEGIADDRGAPRSSPAAATTPPMAATTSSPVKSTSSPVKSTSSPAKSTSSTAKSTSSTAKSTATHESTSTPKSRSPSKGTDKPSSKPTTSSTAATSPSQKKVP